MSLTTAKKAKLVVALIVLISILFKFYLLTTQVKGFLQGDPHEYALMAYRVVFNNKWEAWKIRSWFYSFFLMVPLMFLKLFKVGPGDFFMRFIITAQIFFSTACLLVTFLIGKKIKNTFTGIISVVFLSLNMLFIRWSLSTISEIPATLFFLLSLYYCLKRFNKKPSISIFLGGLSMGFAFAIRYQSIIFLIPICFFLFNRFRQLIYFILSFLIVVLLLGITDYYIYGSFFHSLIEYCKMSLSSKPIEDYGASFWISDRSLYFNDVLNYFSSPEIFFMVITCLLSLKKKRIFFIISNFIFAFLILNFIPHKESRFLLMIIPLMCLLSAVGFDFIKYHVEKTFGLPSKHSVILVAIIFFNIFIFHINKLRYLDLRPFGDIIEGINEILTHDEKPTIVTAYWSAGKEFYFGKKVDVIDLDPTRWKDKDDVYYALKNGQYYFFWGFDLFESGENVEEALKKYNYVLYRKYKNGIYLYKKTVF